MAINCRHLPAVADLEGASRLPLSPLGDGLTPSLTVLLIFDSGWPTVHSRYFYLSKHVKHGSQNIQNDCHQWLCDSFRAHQIRSGRGSAPGGGKSLTPHPTQYRSFRRRRDPAGRAYSAPQTL